MPYCIWIGTPRYGSRDEILGTQWSRHRCFKKRRALKKAAKKLREEMGDGDYILRTQPGGMPLPYRTHKRPSSPKSRRAARRGILF